MVRYPSRTYVTPRTRYLRRIYFAGAAAAIILIVIITLYNLSEQKQSSQAKQRQPQQEQPTPAAPPPVVEEPPEEPARFSMPLDLNEEPLPEAVRVEPEETEPLEKIELEAARVEAAEAEPPEASAEELVDASVGADAQAAAVIDEAMRLLNARPIEVIKARDMLNELLGKPISEQQRNLVKQELSKLADKWLFSKMVYPKDTLCGMYEVQSGDLLSAVGKRYKVPWQILQQINGIPKPEALQADQSIKVINGPFHAKVYRSTFTMDVYLQDTFVRSFPVGLGKPGYETPTGLWVVRPGGKLVKPRWTDPDTGRTYEPDDPNYPLGSRWISLDGLQGQAKGRTGFAIHGTKDPREIGVAKSRGCIRLFNGDVILVYDLVMPGESKVVVTD
jgi:lipoprotein-anchoring transpeptidase ErfK/SrfK